jgi:hypothetical protein
VHGEEGDGFLLCVGLSFDSPRLVGPRCWHRPGEGAQATHGAACRRPEIEIDFGERALSLTATALKKEWADAY